MMNKSVYDKMEDKIDNFNVLLISTFMKQTVKDRVVLVLTKPPKLIYACKVKIGEPKDYNENLKAKAFAQDCNQKATQIPRDLVRHDTEETMEPVQTSNSTQ
jgi:hypothetical protein